MGEYECRRKSVFAEFVTLAALSRLSSVSASVTHAALFFSPDFDLLCIDPFDKVASELVDRRTQHACRQQASNRRQRSSGREDESDSEATSTLACAPQVACFTLHTARWQHVHGKCVQMAVQWFGCRARRQLSRRVCAADLRAWLRCVVASAMLLLCHARLNCSVGRWSEGKGARVWLQLSLLVRGCWRRCVRE